MKAKTRLFCNMTDKELKEEGFRQEGKSWVKDLWKDGSIKEEDEDTSMNEVCIYVAGESKHGTLKRQIRIWVGSSEDKEIGEMIPVDAIIDLVSRGKAIYYTKSQVNRMMLKEYEAKFEEWQEYAKGCEGTMMTLKQELELKRLEAECRMYKPEAVE